MADLRESTNTKHRAMFQHFTRDASQDFMPISRGSLVAQVDESDSLVDLATIEEVELVIWCASVVFPLPGAPTIRLKENSGNPPPWNRRYIDRRSAVCVTRSLGAGLGAFMNLR